MKKSTKLILSVLCFVFCCGMLVFGVYSATSVTYSLSGTIKYEINTLFVDVNTSLYASNQTEPNTASLYALSDSLNNGTTLPENVNKLSYTNSQSTINSSGLSDMDTLSYADAFKVNYGDFNAESEVPSAWTYYLVMELTNKSSELVSATLDLDSVYEQTTNTNVTPLRTKANIEGKSTFYFVTALSFEHRSLVKNSSFSDMTLSVNVGELPTTSNDYFTFSKSGDSYTISSYTGTDEDVVIPSTYEGLPVTKIGNRAFTNSSITSVYIPSSISEIVGGSSSYGAFRNCTSLKTIEMEGNPSIGTSAFYGCSGLENVTLPDNLTTINEYVFYNCRNLKTIEIPSSVRGIDYYAFDGCSNIEEVHIGSIYAWIKITFYTSNSNPLYRSSKAKLYVNGSLITNIKESDFDGVTSIPPHAFRNQTSITSVAIPSSVRTMSTYAFYGCSNIEEVHIESVNSWLKISFGGSSNPLSASSKAKLYVNGSLITDIKESDFNGVTSIQVDVFRNQTSITSVEIPLTVKTIGTYAFSGCSSLESVTLPEGLTTISSSTFRDCTSLKTIEIPSKVTTIGESAFQDCTSLKTIDIPSTVTTIGWRAFDGCSGLESVTIGDGTTQSELTKIDNFAFRGCTSLKTIEIPSSVETIGTYSFDGCSGLENVTIKDGVTQSELTKIDDYAFQNCTRLKTINIPSSVQTIGQYAFRDCTRLKTINIPSSVQTVGQYAFSNCSGLESVTIGDGATQSELTKIDIYAFQNCTRLKTIDIPSSVTTIGTRAFDGCSNIEEVNIDSINSWLKISFNYDSSNPLYASSKAKLYVNGSLITNIKESDFDGVTSIQEDVFRNQTSITLVEIPSDVGTIGKRAFQGCSGLESVTLPEGMTTISSSTFQDCTSLKTIEIPSKVTTIGRYAFSGCSDLESVTIGDGVTQSELTKIDNYAFQDCTSLKTIEIPSKVTTIGSIAFSGCSDLESVTIGDGTTQSELKTIDYRAFDNCTSLKTIEIPSTVTTIDSSAFSGCRSLAIVFNSSSISSISAGSAVIVKGAPNPDNYVTEDSGLYYKLDDSTKVFINPAPDGNTLTFSDTTVSQYTVNAKLSELGLDKKAVTKIVLEEGVESIGYSAFQNFVNLKTVEINSSVLSTIDSQAFYNCSNIEEVHIYSVNSWLKISFGNSSSNPLYASSKAKLYVDRSLITNIKETDFADVARVPNYAFYRQTSITSVEIPSTVTTIGSYAFSGCSNIEEVNIGSVNSWLKITFDSNSSSNPLSQTSKAKLYVDGNLITTVQESDFDGVTSISSYAFYNQTSITSVVIPSSVQTIGQYAFYGCSGLESVTILDDFTQSELTKIDSYAFSGCTSLKTIEIPSSVTTIGLSTFSGCSSLENVTLPEGMTTISSSTFQDCTSLKTIEIPSTVTSIGSNAFEGCSNLESVTIDSTQSELKTIGYQAFCYCKSLKTIDIPSKVTTIGRYAFEGCSNLESVTILDDFTQSELNTIDNYAFRDCTSLKTINIPSSVTTIGRYAFENCTNTKEVHIDSVYAWLKLCSTFNTDQNNYDQNPLYVSSIAKLYIGNDLLTKIESSDFDVETPITSIPYYAFYRQSQLTSVEIPSEVTTIGESAFEGCSGLESVTIGDGTTQSELTKIDSDAFRGCTSLKTIEIPSSVETIGSSAFDGCSGLESVTIGDGTTQSELTKIDSYAFFSCTSLKTIEIPSTVITIGGSAFSGCSSLDRIIVESESVLNALTGTSSCGGILGNLAIFDRICILSTLVEDENGNLDSAKVPDYVKNNYTLLTLTETTIDGSKYYIYKHN